jgi:DNA helicase II / ATP-dependent DNA helicase PcrA
LREWYDKAGLVKHFTIADEERQLRVLARVAPMLAGEKDARRLLRKFSETRLNSDELPPLSALEKQFQRRYEGELRKNCLIDFDDILFLTERLFFEHPTILNRYRKSFDAILIDEFQDTDRVQYEIIKQLAGEHSNLFVVADDDQSIFSWRGANPRNIDLFKHDFAQEQVIVLTENYRSRPEILAQAAMLISQNPRLNQKGLQAVRSGAQNETDALRMDHFATDAEEAEFIIKEIRRQMERNENQRFSDFAVLYARHSVGEFLEREMMKANMPCQLVRGRSCLDQPEIVRAIHLLRLLYNTKDQLSLEQFIAEEVDEVTFTRLKTLQREEGIADFRLALDRFHKCTRMPEQERRQIERAIGLISNLMAFKASGRNRRLSDLFAEILSSLKSQEVLTLDRSAEKLTDPIFYIRMPDAARALSEAQAAQRPVVISANNSQIQFIAIEILKRALGITPLTLQSFIRPRIVNEEQSPLAPLLIALDGGALPLLTSLPRSWQGIIYLGIEYGPQLREELHELNAIVINPEELSVAERGFEPTATALLYKLCQATAGLRNAEFLADYVALDIETTDRDVETNDIIELAAVRVRDGIPGEHYHTMLKPGRAISADAGRVHGITEEELANAPGFNDAIDQLLAFMGEDMLVAHNGYNFDFPCINRKLREAGRQRLGKRLFDTLPMASRLYPDRGASLDALASVFDIDTGQRHRAYDDTMTLIEIFERLKKEHASRLRRTSCEHCLDLVAAGIVIEQGQLADPGAVLIKGGLARLAAPNSNLIERLAESGEEVGRLCSLVENIRTENFREGTGSSDRLSAFIHFDEIVARYDRTDPSEENLEESIVSFLDFVSLYQQQDGIRERNAVNLMTIYAAKGLEFSRVFIVGLEQNMIPSFYAVGSRNAEQLAEQRRLLYVAITRAQDQLIFTTAATRNGYPQAASEFLSELSIR